jgi:hypothetical protein
MESSESRIAPSPEAESDDFASPLNLPEAEERAYWRGVADGLSRAGAPVPAGIAARSEPAQAPPSESPSPPPQIEPPEKVEPREETGRKRHDAFTGLRKQAYLKALGKAGCIADACRMTGVSSTTVYKHQSSDPEFARNCRLALGMASVPIELTAYERAVVGVEEDVIRGGKVVGTRIRRSDYMLRILLQASNPKKYGPRPGFTRKRLVKFERDQIKREVKAELEAKARARNPRRDGNALFDILAERLQQIDCEASEARRSAGWTELGCGISVPPGWTWTGEGDPASSLADPLQKGDAVYASSTSSTSPETSSPESAGEGDQAENGGGAAAAAQEDPPQESPAPATPAPPPPVANPPSPASGGEADSPSLPPNPPNP